MKCNLEVLSEYYDGELSGEERRRVEAHLAQCPSCAAVLAEYRQVSQAIKRMPVQPAPTMLEDDLTSRLSEPPHKTWWRRLVGPAVEFGVIAATAVLVIAVVSGALQGLDLRTRPAITAATPGAGSVDVPTKTTIKVTFDRPMDRASVEAAVAIAPPLKVDYLWRGDDLFLVPREPLQPGTTYRVIVDQSAKDGQGRSMPVAFSLEFTTAGAESPHKPAVAADETPPSTPASPVAIVSEPPTPTRQMPTPAPGPSVPAPGPQPKSSPKPEGTAETRAAVASPVPDEVTPTPQPQPFGLEPPRSCPEQGEGACPEPSVPTEVPTPTSPVPFSTGVAIAVAPKVTPSPTMPTVIRGFGLVYEQNPRVRERLGPPLEPERGILAGEQPFQRGHMFWRGDLKVIYVLNADGTWGEYEDSWGQDEPQGMGLEPPPDLFEPIRGFGKVWRNVTGVREELGWGLYKERGFIGAVQEFARGVMLWSNQRTIYVLYSDGTWERFVDSYPE